MGKMKIDTLFLDQLLMGHKILYAFIPREVKKGDYG